MGELLDIQDDLLKETQAPCDISVGIFSPEDRQNTTFIFNF